MTDKKLTINSVIMFDGVEQTLRSVVAKYTAYNDQWIRAAIRAGCSSGQDLAKRWAENQHRSRVNGGQGGKAAILKYKKGSYK